MRSRSGRAACWRRSWSALALAMAPVAAAKVRVSFERLKGFDAPGTPAKYDKVGVLKIGPRRARNVLVLNPGTSASASYFVPLAKDVVTRAKGWQVWAVERRENLLEDHSMFNKAKAGKATPAAGLRLLPALPDRLDDHQALPADPRPTEVGVRARVGHARGDRGPPPGRQGGQAAAAARSCWAATRSAARSRPRTPPGTSTAGRAPSDLRGLVFIDGGSGPTPVTARAGARRRSQSSSRGSIALADVRRDRGAVRGPLQHQRLARRR